MEWLLLCNIKKLSKIKDLSSKQEETLRLMREELEILEQEEESN